MPAPPVSTASAGAAPLALPPQISETGVRAPASSALAAGTELTVRLGEVLDSDSQMVQEYVAAEVPEDIQGSDGKTAFQAGSHALLVIRKAGTENDLSTLGIALHSIFAGSRQVRFTDGQKDLAALTFTQNAADGRQHRTVHLADGTFLHFKLDSAMSLK